MKRNRANGQVDNKKRKEERMLDTDLREEEDLPRARPPRREGGKVIYTRRGVRN